CPPCGSAKSTTFRAASARHPNWSTMICSDSVPARKRRRASTPAKTSSGVRVTGMYPPRPELPREALYHPRQAVGQQRPHYRRAGFAATFDFAAYGLAPTTGVPENSDADFFACELRALSGSKAAAVSDKATDDASGAGG